MSGEVDERFPTGLRCWVESPTAIVDICFVHGLGGNRFSTWTSEGAEPWPKSLLSGAVPNARILSYGYDAYVLQSGVASGNRLTDHATNFLASLTANREEDNVQQRPIILVAHSLGGLVCKQAILISDGNSKIHLRNVFKQLKGIIFLGTPHQGSWMADWSKIPAKALGVVKSTNPTLLEVLQINNEHLQSLHRRFLNKLQAVERDSRGQRTIETTCFYEEYGLPVVGKVVTKESATFDHEDPYSIGANHIGMAKFSSAQDEGYKLVVGEIRRWVRQIGVARPSSSPPSPATDSNHRGATSRPSALNDHSIPTGVSGPNRSRELSNLSELDRQFVSIRREEYQEFQRFIRDHREILQRNPNIYIQAAVEAMRLGSLYYAYQCIQGALILRRCTELGSDRFFNDIRDPNKDKSADFNADFHKMCEALEERAKARQPLGSQTDISGDRTSYSSSRSIPQLSSSTAFIRGRYGEFLQDQVPPQRLNAQIESQRRFHAVEEFSRDRGQSERPNAQYESRLPRHALSEPSKGADISAESGEDGHQDDTSANVQEADKEDFFMVLPERPPSIDPDIRGTEGDRENLDPRYHKRPDAKRFFVVGQVFALLWHGSAGEGKPGAEPSLVEHTTVGRYGQRVFSHIRRLVVVREREGYCVCIPIQTYGGRGVMKHGLSTAERQAHSIIHARDTAPYAREEEQAFLIKKPIAVKMASKEQKLDRMSRINFGKPSSVEWNVKVMHVGRVESLLMTDLARSLTLQSSTAVRDNLQRLAK